MKKQAGGAWPGKTEVSVLLDGPKAMQHTRHWSRVRYSTVVNLTCGSCKAETRALVNPGLKCKHSALSEP